MGDLAPSFDRVPQSIQADLKQLTSGRSMFSRPIAYLPAAARDACCQAAREHIPAEEAMIRRLTWKIAGIAPEYFLADGR